MITSKPISLFSWTFELSDADGYIATIQPSLFREKAQLDVRGELYDVWREGVMHGRFILSYGGREAASAEKPSAFQRRFLIQSGTRRFTLKAESVFGRAFLLMEDDRFIGSVRPRHLFSRRAYVDFPEDIDLSVRVFLFALVLTSFKAKTAPVILGTFIENEGMLQWGALAALGVCTILPTILFMVFLQKFLIKGLTLGALKG